MHPAIDWLESQTTTLARRYEGPEFIDAPDVNPHALRSALDRTAWLDRALFGHLPTIEGIEHLLHPKQRQFTLLDVGCGDGVTLRGVAQWARRAGLGAELVGTESVRVAANHARVRCAGFRNIRIHALPIHRLPPTAQFDIVHAGRYLHRFASREELVRQLRAMARHARLGIVINDWHRTGMAYHGLRMVTRIASGHPIIRYDIPMSIARGFRRNELRELAARADLRIHKIEWRWPFRWLLVLK